MPIFPLRNLAQHGVITDPDPYDIPITAWSFAQNVRFRNGRVTRGPVFRTIKTLATASPRFVLGSTPNSGLDFLFIGYLNGKVYRYQSATETDWSIAGYTPSSVEGNWTSTHLADVIYINRADRPPWYLRLSDSQFQNLAGAGGGGQPWNATWSCQILRSCASALVAFNVTKAGTNFPTMVKTSSFAQASTVPLSWDQTLPATNATENILAEMEGPIIDAQPLQQNMVIYGQRESWLMTFVAGTNVWDYRQLFKTKGAINANCVIEIDGVHYVFGAEDIWRHDGVTTQSVADGRVREFIYGSLNAAFANRCFVQHNPILKELTFNYVSGDSFVGFVAPPDGCNRSATYDYQNNRWTFDDMPLVYSASNANLDQTLLYSTATQTYNTIGGSYQSLGDTFKKSYVCVGDVNATYGLTASLYAFDPAGALSQVSAPVDTKATLSAFMKRDGLDLDELGKDLPGYKTCNTIYPQGRLELNAQPLQFSVGSADYFNSPSPGYSAYQTWDGNTLYKLDFNAAGRYLSMQVLFQDYRYFSLSGYDVDLDTYGER